MTESTSGPSVTVRECARADLPWTAARHRGGLPHGLFPRLGTGFLRRWHRTFLEDSGVALVAEVAGGAGPVPVGFLLGSTDQAAHTAHVLSRHRPALALRGALALVLRPHVALGFLRTRARAYAGRLVTAPARVPAGPREPVAVVTAVAVDPPAQGLGVGAALVEALVERARAAGTDRVELATLAGPQGASGFYEHLGWTLVRERRNRDGHATRTYRRDLGDEAAGPLTTAGTRDGAA